MLQLVVEDTERLWAEHRPERFVEEFGLKAPKPPAMQPWG